MKTDHCTASPSSGQKRGLKSRDLQLHVQSLITRPHCNPLYDHVHVYMYHYKHQQCYSKDLFTTEHLCASLPNPVKMCQQPAILPSTGKGNHLPLASHWSSWGTSQQKEIPSPCCLLLLLCCLLLQITLTKLPAQ